MQTLKAYLYPIVVEVQIPDPTITLVRKRTVYTHPIKVYKGIDNPIQILARNQDNKPIDLTDHSLIVIVQDDEVQEPILSYSVIFSDITHGEGSIIITKNDLEGLDQRRYKLAVKKVNDIDFNETPAYTDANYGLLLDIEVLPGFH